MRERQRQLFYRWKGDWPGLVWAMHRGSLNRYSISPQCFSNPGLGNHQGSLLETGDVVNSGQCYIVAGQNEVAVRSVCGEFCFINSAILLWGMLKRSINKSQWFNMCEVMCEVMCKVSIDLPWFYFAEFIHLVNPSQVSCENSNCIWFSLPAALDWELLLTAGYLFRK